MALSVGKIALDLTLNKSLFGKQLRDINTQADKVSTSMSSQFKKNGKIGKAVAAVFPVKKIVDFGKECINLGSDLSEVQNVVDVTFSGMSEKVNKFAKSAAATYGLSETMAKKYTGLYGSMAKAFGFTEEKAFAMSTTLTGLAGDVASFYNISQDEAYTKLKSVFSGETETLKDLGVVMTQNALDAYALANGYGKTTAKMTEMEKVSLRYAFVQKQLATAQGDFARTSDGWANQTRILKLNFDSLKATLGQGFINVLTPVIKTINTLMSKLQGLAQQVSDFFTQTFGGSAKQSSGGSVSTEIAEATNSAENLSDSTNAVTDNLSDTNKEAKKLKNNLAGFDKLNVLSFDNDTEDNTGNNGTSASTTPTMGSSTIKPVSVPLEVDVDDNKLNAVTAKIKNFCGTIKNAFAAVDESFKNVWNNGTGERVLTNLKRLAGNFLGVVDDIAGAFTKAWNNGKLGDKVVQSFIDKWNSLISIINTVAEDFRDVWNDGTGEQIWTNILTVITNCNNATKTLREKIKLAWEKNDTGKRIWQDILGIVEDISKFLADISEINLEWLESLDLSPIMEAVEKLAGAFRELLKACGDKLKTVYKKVLQPLAKWSIEKAVPKLVEALAEALKLVAGIIKKIPDKALYALAGGITAIGTAVIVFKTGQTVANGIAKITGAIESLGTVMASHPVLAIAGVIAGITVAVMEYNQLQWSNSEAVKWADGVEKISKRLETIKQDIEDMTSDALASFNDMSAEITVIDDYKQRLNELLDKANLTDSEQAELVTIADYFSSKSPEFKDAWDNFCKRDSEGHLELQGNIDLTQEKLNTLIDTYRYQASASVLNDLSVETKKSSIIKGKEIQQEKKNYNSKLKDYQNFLKKWKVSEKDFDKMQFAIDEDLIDRTLTSSSGDIMDYATFLEEARIKKDALDKAKNTYNDTAKELNNLKMDTEDYSSILRVLNGDYSDAAAVMLAFNSQLINEDDITKSIWGSLSKCKDEAKKSGKNLVLGMHEGTQEYIDTMKTDGEGLITTILDAADTAADMHSPSREMRKRGLWLVQGLHNGISAMLLHPINLIKKLVTNLLSPFNGLKKVFAGIFSGVWSAIKPIINSMLSGIEGLINGFINGINSMITAVDKIAEALGGLFGQDWHVEKIPELHIPKLARGGLVKAPTLAMVGDNRNARTDPEVVAPLSKLRGMIGNDNQTADTTVFAQMLMYMKKLYELMLQNNTSSNEYRFVAECNGNVLFEQAVKENEIYKKRHGGRSAFEGGFR